MSSRTTSCLCLQCSRGYSGWWIRRTGSEVLVPNALLFGTVLLVALLLVTVLCTPARAIQDAAGSDAVVIRTLAGEKIEGKLEGIDAAGNLLGQGMEGMQISDLTSLRTEVEQQKVPVNSVVRLVSGGQFQADGVEVADGYVSWKSTVGEYRVSVGAVRAIVFKPFELSDLVTRVIEQPSDESDQVVAEGSSGQQAVSGLLEAITDDRVDFNFRGTSRSIPLDRVVAVVMVDLQQRLPEGPRVNVKLSDGSAVGGVVQGLENGVLKLALVGGESVDLAWDNIVAINVRSDRLVFLSDLTPLEFEHVPIVAPQTPLAIDQSIEGKPLKLYAESEKQAVEYSRGIAMRSESRVSYRNEGYGRFAASCGIDWEAKGNGDCVVKILGDGIELWSGRIRGRQEPLTVDLRVADYTEITFVVEAGEHLDLADHVDIVDARFIKDQ